VPTKQMGIGLVLPMVEAPQSGEKPRWATIKSIAQRAEDMGFDTVWVADELLWRVPDWPGPRGWWECVSVAGAVAASTTTIGVGSWVLSALHRNPGLTVKVAETLDEISDGRFVLGLGAGHAGDQGATFGYPDDKTVSRYEAALEIIVPRTARRNGVPRRSVSPGALPRDPPARPASWSDPVDVGSPRESDDAPCGTVRRHLECFRHRKQHARVVRSDARTAR
jgi:alkanesulfonate monooxygenase SsuD/methylene tetrahydromethanopterin reductase-like flavin-dependent oxidoreductase (luciferase family)